MRTRLIAAKIKVRVELFIDDDECWPEDHEFREWIVESIIEQTNIVQDRMSLSDIAKFYLDSYEIVEQQDDLESTE